MSLGSFKQGYLDSLCAVYAIVNAEKIINKSSFDESQELFNTIIVYLSKKRMLRDAIINGMKHRRIEKIMGNIIGDRIPFQVTNKRFYNLKEWWQTSLQHLTEKENRVILLSIAGREDHLTVVKSMSNKAMYLHDSGAWGGIKTIRKSGCKTTGYSKDDKYVIYPSQTWFLGKE